MKVVDIQKDGEHAGNSFPQTEWEIVQTAAQPATRNPALEKLLNIYLPFLEGYIVSQFLVSSDQAKDWLQGFIMEKILRKNLMLAVNRSRGKFRTFIVRSLHNYIIQQMRRENAAKRAPLNAAVSLCDLQESQFAEATAQSVHGGDVAWARGLLATALLRTRAYCHAAGRQDAWGVFEQRLLNPFLHNVEPASYEELVRQHGYRSTAQAANTLITVKRIFDRQLRSLIAQYVQDEAAVEAELVELKEILFQAAPETNSPEFHHILRETAQAASSWVSD